MAIDTFFTHGIINSGLTIIVTLILLFLFSQLLTGYIKKRWSTHRVFLLRIKKNIVWILAIVIVFLQIKPLQSLSTTLLASGGFLAVAVALASQEAASNIINGILIYGYKPYVIHDSIVLPEKQISGKVIDITLRHTVVETNEKTQIIIPNTTMNKSVIENTSSLTDHKVNYLIMQIDYNNDLEKAITIIERVISDLPDQKSSGNTPKVQCIDGNPTAITLRATLLSLDSSTGLQMTNDARKQVLLAFQKEGIMIPSYQIQK